MRYNIVKKGRNVMERYKDLEGYLNEWQEGDNITITCDLLNAIESALNVIKELKGEKQNESE